MECKGIVKIFMIMICSAVSLNSMAASNIKQMNSRLATLNGDVQSWGYAPPYEGYGFGEFYDDHRIQKIIVHVNEKLSTGEMAGTVKLICNGTKYQVDPGHTVVCERSLDNFAGVFPLDPKVDVASEGTIKFIMEDIN